MILIGLTGGIASGKSSVARLLEKKGAVVIDADKVWHELLKQNGPAKQQVIERFGKEILGPHGEVERPKLGKIVFSDSQALKDLEAISHPAIFGEVMRRVEKARSSDGVVVIDAALLVDREGLSGSGFGIQALVVVSANPADQIERQIRDRGASEDDARSRIRAQAPPTTKLAKADYVIDNRGTLEELGASVDTLWRDLLERFS